MCGIAGFWQAGPREQSELLVTAERMADALRLRGPDAAGTFCDAAAGVAFGHRRLAILDLSREGQQPMQSRSGRWTVAYNGEVYNHQDLRRELGDHPFRGSSDTETLVEALDAWGPEAVLKRANGMFALAAWDAHERRLYLARDRLGIKPLYFGVMDRTLLFASRPAALAQHPAWTPSPDPMALGQYAHLGYVAGPRSIFRGLWQVPPATLITFADRREVATNTYWSPLAFSISRGGASVAQLREELWELIRDAVRLRTLSDVPLGAFLSGGVDSALVCAALCSLGLAPRSFAIGFSETAYDEAPDARATAAHLGTHHTELRTTPGEARRVIPLLVEHHDEPFADPSAIPTFLVSRLAREHVTVSLSGDGGDELFAGYARYLHALQYHRTARWAGSVVRWTAGSVCGLVPSGSAMRAPWQVELAQRAQRASRILLDADARHYYLGKVSLWPYPEQVLARPSRFPVDAWLDRWWGGRPPEAIDSGHLLAAMQSMDLETYLPGAILTKVDRASMAVSLEARVPLLDHRIVEFAARVPPTLRVRGKRGKWLLRELLAEHLPRDFVNRPKRGFGIPLGEWLRGPLREWAESLLSTAALRDAGAFDPSIVAAIWRAHLNGRPGFAHALWLVLAYQMWHARWGR